MKQWLNHPWLHFTQQRHRKINCTNWVTEFIKLVFSFSTFIRHSLCESIPEVTLCVWGESREESRQHWQWGQTQRHPEQKHSQFSCPLKDVCWHKFALQCKHCVYVYVPPRYKTAANKYKLRSCARTVSLLQTEKARFSLCLLSVFLTEDFLCKGFHTIAMCLCVCLWRCRARMCEWHRGTQL